MTPGREPGQASGPTEPSGEPAGSRHVDSGKPAGSGPTDSSAPAGSREPSGASDPSVDLGAGLDDLFADENFVDYDDDGLNPFVAPRRAPAGTAEEVATEAASPPARPSAAAEPAAADSPIPSSAPTPPAAGPVAASAPLLPGSPAVTGAPTALPPLPSRRELRRADAAESETEMPPGSASAPIALPSPGEPWSLDPVPPEPLPPEPWSLDPVVHEPLPPEPWSLDPVVHEPSALEPSALEPSPLSPGMPPPGPQDPLPPVTWSPAPAPSASASPSASAEPVASERVFPEPPSLPIPPQAGLPAADPLIRPRSGRRGVASASDGLAADRAADRIPRPAVATPAPRSRRAPLRLVWASLGALNRALVVVGGLVLVALLVVGGVALGRALMPSAPGSDSGTPAGGQGSGPLAPGVHAWDALRGGECVEPYESVWAEQFTVVDCAQPHAAQLAGRGIVGVEVAEYPDLAGWQALVPTLCDTTTLLDLEAAEAYPDLRVELGYPGTVEAWDAGDRDYFCFVSLSAGGPIDGSLLPAS